MGQDDQSRRARIETEAAEWLVRLEAGDADLDAFERWRGDDPAHAAAFAQIDAAWARMDRAAALRPPGPIDPDLFSPPDGDNAKGEQRMSRRWLLRAAAVGGLTLATGGGAALLMTGRASAETGVGERRAVRLPDGSLLDLNTDSRASWQFTERARKVWLERGEAAIEVVADREARPFLLAARGRSIALDQGVFNARLRGADTEFAVLRGEADVAGEGVGEGRAVTLNTSTAAVGQLTPAAVDATTAWRRGEIIFDGDTLQEAVAEYNRYLTMKIEIDDPTIAGVQLGGRFETRDPAEFLASLESAFPVRVTRADDGTVHLSAQERPI